MINYIKDKWENSPLQLIVFAGLFFRMLAVIFSKGYGMHDDHFLIIEDPQSWVDGMNNNFPPTNPNSIPDGHSWFYSGLHYLLFKLFDNIGFTDPNLKMYVVRFLHALFSMLTIVLGYKITKYYGGRNIARTAGLLLAIMWFMPNTSVRNLVEVVCIPFLMYATWLIIKVLDTQFGGCTPQPIKRNINLIAFWAGCIAGLAFSVRFQSVIFIGGFGLTLLILKKWKETIFFGFGSLLSIVLIQGGIDTLIWGRPFVEFQEYVNYNLNNAYSYSTQPWYNYFLTLGGLMLPPISLFLLVGFFKMWKKYVLLFLPSFLFLAFHSYFPNKQERFIFPIIPFIIVLGMIGWTEFKNSSTFWQKRQKLLRGCWKFFWIVNTLPLLFVTVSYSKRNRVEAMIYLQKKGDVKNVILEESMKDGITMIPQFYLKKWITPIGITTLVSCDSAKKIVHKLPQNEKPNYILFVQEEGLEKRVENFTKTYGNITYEATIKPGLLDEIMHWLNKENENFTTTIYKIET